jgi:hypothetical protein
VSSRPRTSRYALVLVALLTALVLAFAGCGGDDGGGGGGSSSDTATEAIGGSDSGSTDLDAKTAAATAQVAIETFAAVDQGGSYDGAGLSTLQQLDPTIPDDVEVTASTDGYEIVAPSESGSYTVTRAADGTVTRTCEPAGEGECPSSGEW